METLIWRHCVGLAWSETGRSQLWAIVTAPKEDTESPTMMANSGHTQGDLGVRVAAEFDLQGVVPDGMGLIGKEEEKNFVVG